MGDVLGEGVMILNRVVWILLTEKVRLKQRLEGDERERFDLRFKGHSNYWKIEAREERTQ